MRIDAADLKLTKNSLAEDVAALTESEELEAPNFPGQDHDLGKDSRRGLAQTLFLSVDSRSALVAGSLFHIRGREVGVQGPCERAFA